MIETLADWAQHFAGLFGAGGEALVGMVSGIIPTLFILLTFVNMIVKLIGEERVMRVAQRCTKYSFTRYAILPVVANIALAEPMSFSFGRFLEEKHKAAYFESCISFLHPATGIFPHVTPAELFVYLGIASGITQLGLNANLLAVWYFITGVVVIYMRGLVTERIYAILAARHAAKQQAVAVAAGGQ